MLEARLLEKKEDIEEITDGADKQLGIEKKLKEMEELWSRMRFDFAEWKIRGDVIFQGPSTNKISILVFHFSLTRVPL